MTTADKSKERGVFYVENLGCSKNQVDAESIIAALEANSWTATEDADKADLIIVNSCGFLESARKESIDVTLSFRQHYPDKRIVMAGCLAERDGIELSELLPEVDGFFGNRALGKITEVAPEVLSGKRTLLFPKEYRHAAQGSPKLSMKGSAYLKIAEGCDNRCSFCSIPLIRGGLRSRPVGDVIDDATMMVESGVQEINVIAQDLGSYGKDRGAEELIPLLESLLEITGDPWIRLLYIHPDRFPSGLPDLCAENPALLPYFDLPVQHASKPILAKMGRTGDAATYLRLVESIREKLPDAVVRSTFLVGYPGESRADFEELTVFQKRARFDWLGAFTYSRERGTVAGAPGLASWLRYRITAAAADNRLSTIQQIQQQISEDRAKRFVGRDLPVLIEERIQGEELFFGRIYGQAPEVDGLTVVHGGSLETGRRVDCRIVKANGFDLEAVPV